MGTKRVKKQVTKQCFHTSGMGKFCGRCGSLKTQIGFITEYEEVLETCWHNGEYGKQYCSQCGDRIGFNF